MSAYCLVFEQKMLLSHEILGTDYGGLPLIEWYVSMYEQHAGASYVHTVFIWDRGEPV